MPHYIYDEPDDRNYIVLPPGEYDFVIVEVYEFETTKSGNEYLPIKLQIQHEDVVVYDNLVFSQKAKFRIDQLLKSIGKAPAPGSAVDFDDPSWLVGCKGRCRLRVEEYNGIERNKVDAYVFRPGQVSGRSVTAPKPAVAPPLAAEDDDDTPF